MIADGSKIRANIPQSSMFANLQVDYFWREEWREDRFLFLIKQVTTKYATFLDDEDALIPDSFSHIMNFLDSNPDFSCAGGEVYEVIRDDGLKLRGWNRFSGEVAFSNASPWQRMERCIRLNQTANVCYQITRSADLKKISGEVWASIPSRGKEILWVLTLLWQGKFLKMPYIPYWIRNNLNATSNPKVANEILSTESTKLILVGSLARCAQNSFWKRKKLEFLMNRIYGINTLQSWINLLRNELFTILSPSIRFIRSFARHVVYTVFPKTRESIHAKRVEKSARRLTIPKQIEDYAFAKDWPDASRQIQDFLQIWDQYPDGLDDTELLSLMNTLKN